MSIGQEIIKDMEGFLANLQSGEPIPATRVERTPTGYVTSHVVLHTTPKEPPEVIG